MVTLEDLNRIGTGKLPGHLGIVITHAGVCAKPVHLGKTTHVWDATVTRKETGKSIACFAARN